MFYVKKKLFILQYKQQILDAKFKVRNVVKVKQVLTHDLKVSSKILQLKKVFFYQNATVFKKRYDKRISY